MTGKKHCQIRDSWPNEKRKRLLGRQSNYVKQKDCRSQQRHSFLFISSIPSLWEKVPAEKWWRFSDMISMEPLLTRNEESTGLTLLHYIYECCTKICCCQQRQITVFMTKVLLQLLDFKLSFRRRKVIALCLQNKVWKGRKYSPCIVSEVLTLRQQSLSKLRINRRFSGFFSLSTRICEDPQGSASDEVRDHHASLSSSVTHDDCFLRWESQMFNWKWLFASRKMR